MDFPDPDPSDHVRSDPAGSPEAETQQARTLAALFALADRMTDEDRARAVLRGSRTWTRFDLYGEAPMWHDEPEVVEFLAAARRACAAPAVVVELGSYRMHDHDPRPRWPSARWYGIDARPGPGVDLVGLAHEAIWRILAWHGGDVVVLSVSALEHDPHWRETLAAARELARIHGGIVAVTCAGPGWEPHELDCAPGGPWYENRTSAEIADVLQPGSSRCDQWDTLRTCAPHWVRSNVIATYTRAANATLIPVVSPTIADDGEG